MRKLIVGTACAALLVPATGSVAFAGPDDGYPGVIKTTTSVKGPTSVKAGSTKKYTAKLIVASDGNPCKGAFNLKVTKGEDVVQEGSTGIDGGSASFKVSFDAGPGKYVVKVRYVPKDQSSCKGSHDEKNVKAKRGRG